MTQDIQVDPATLPVDLHDVQGNILRGYRKLKSRHLTAKVKDANAAKNWVAAVSAKDASGGPVVTRGSDWGDNPPDVCLNIGVTYAGLRALGVPSISTESFSDAYKQGMVARADKIGDWTSSAPEHWQPQFQDNDALHLILTLHANTSELMDDYEALIMSSGGDKAFTILGRNQGEEFDPGIVHFGYRDGISQPRFPGVSKPGRYDDQPIAPFGTVLLGYSTAMEQLTWTLPNPELLGKNGAFGAFRVLEQDVEGFEAYLDYGAKVLLDSDIADDLLPPDFAANNPSDEERFAAMREVVAGKFAGRWRTGTPLALSPREPSPEPPVSDTNFDYSDDIDGLKCPLGSHLRRSNPRSSKIVQRVSNHTRRLVRRNLPYGPEYDPANPTKAERGLVGYFICADISAQFEALQYDWINLGLQDPRITGVNDPLLGDNDADASWFDVDTENGSVRLCGFPKFVMTRGGAYVLLPSLTALRWLGSL
ncbi:MAG: Dyp-type peroxidase [Pikeienuella sp.]